MGRSPCCEKEHTNKGAWTKEEDDHLINYIKLHGEGRWRSLPKAAGLLRCGKSCRLRWINYLRPDLKRGNFTEQEDDLIIKLHSLLGNKWSLIASRLPGRTDNEIKNYWNTHIKRKLLSRGIDPQSHRSLLPLNTATTAAPSKTPTTSTRNNNIDHHNYRNSSCNIIMTSSSQLEVVPTSSNNSHQLEVVKVDDHNDVRSRGSDHQYETNLSVDIQDSSTSTSTSNSTAEQLISSQLNLDLSIGLVSASASSTTTAPFCMAKNNINVTAESKPLLQQDHEQQQKQKYDQQFTCYKYNNIYNHHQLINLYEGRRSANHPSPEPTLSTTTSTSTCTLSGAVPAEIDRYRYFRT